MQAGQPAVAGYIARWRPSSVSPQAAAFARDVITAARAGRAGAGEEPAVGGGKLADYAASLGLDPVPGGAAAPVGGRAVHPVRAGAVAGGAADAAHEPAVHRPAGRAAAVSGGSAAAPGTGQAAVQPGGDQRVSSRWRTPSPRPERRMRAAGLVCLGAGAGLIRGDLRDVRGTDVACRSGGVVVTVRGARPRTVPVLARYHARLLAAARFAGNGLVCGGADPGRRNLDEPADQRAGRRGRAAPAGHLPAAGDLAARLRGAARAGHVHARGRDQLLPAARRPARRAGAGRRGRGGPAARGRPAMIPLAAFEEIIDASGIAPRIEAMLPIGVRARQLRVRTLLLGMCSRSPITGPPT